MIVAWYHTGILWVIAFSLFLMGELGHAQVYQGQVGKVSVGSVELRAILLPVMQPACIIPLKPEKKSPLYPIASLSRTFPQRNPNLITSYRWNHGKKGGTPYEIQLDPKSKLPMITVTTHTVSSEGKTLDHLEVTHVFY